MRPFHILVLTMLLGACTQSLPGETGTESARARAADFPTLLPLDPLLATANAPSSIKAQSDDLTSRVARLKARAAALRGRDIFTGAERLKLLGAGSQ